MVCVGFQCLGQTLALLIVSDFEPDNILSCNFFQLQGFDFTSTVLGSFTLS
jgi:hypothetical protein